MQWYWKQRAYPLLFRSPGTPVQHGTPHWSHARRSASNNRQWPGFPAFNGYWHANSHFCLCATYPLVWRACYCEARQSGRCTPLREGHAWLFILCHLARKCPSVRCAEKSWNYSWSPRLSSFVSFFFFFLSWQNTTSYHITKFNLVNRSTGYALILRLSGPSHDLSEHWAAHWIWAPTEIYSVSLTLSAPKKWATAKIGSLGGGNQVHSFIVPRPSA